MNIREIINPSALLTGGFISPLSTEASPSRSKDRLAIVCASGNHAADVARQFGISTSARANEHVMILTPGQAVIGHRFHTVLITDAFSTHLYHSGQRHRESMERWINEDLTIRVGHGKIIRL